MKIAINCAFFQPKGGGIKEYIQNLVENISILDSENEYILYILKDQFDYTKQNLNTNFRIKVIPYKSEGLVNKIIRSLSEDKFWRKEELIEKWDIFHSPFFHGPKLKKAKLILTVHDLRFFRYPKTYTWLRYFYLKYAVKRSITNANHIISISQFTKDEICAAYNIDQHKITVIHEAVNPVHFTSYNLNSIDLGKLNKISPKDFILTVGHLEPRKNYNVLISSFLRFKKESIKSKNLKLVIVGKKGHDYQSTIDLINRHSNDIIYLDFVSQSLLNWLYANALLFIFPSIYEGFGFPPLEAACHDLVSAVSNTSCIPEICENGAFYFDPYSEESIVRTINESLYNESERKKVLEKIKERLKSFSWEKNASETIKLYRTII